MELQDLNKPQGPVVPSGSNVSTNTFQVLCKVKISPHRGHQVTQNRKSFMECFVNKTLWRASSERVHFSSRRVDGWSGDPWSFRDQTVVFSFIAWPTFSLCLQVSPEISTEGWCEIKPLAACGIFLLLRASPLKYETASREGARPLFSRFSHWPMHSFKSRGGTPCSSIVRFSRCISLIWRPDILQIQRSAFLRTSKLHTGIVWRVVQN